VNGSVDTEPVAAVGPRLLGWELCCVACSAVRKRVPRHLRSVVDDDAAAAAAAAVRSQINADRDLLGRRVQQRDVRFARFDRLIVLQRRLAVDVEGALMAGGRSLLFCALLRGPRKWQYFCGRRLCAT
jgi:hypothetical protein